MSTTNPAITAGDFETALKNGQLFLAYQPIIDLTSGKPKGLEALMRWTHPVHGTIPPGVFIPIAEESGLIIQASRWALKEACRALQRIVGQVGYDRSLFISVNFSAVDFADENFLEQVYTAIAATDIKPSLVRLEITETLLQNEPDAACATLGLCRKAGLGIAIDDFNIGSSSLEWLHGFGIDTVKIDEIASDNIHKIILRARELGMITIAEGVEEAVNVDMLRVMGCDMAQGYYFARPLEEHAIIDTLRKWDVSAPVRESVTA